MPKNKTKTDAKRPAEWKFSGFSPLRVTAVPDEFFDELAPMLKEGELRVALYIIRRTLGFKKRSDSISIKQMVDGIKRSDGTVLDKGTGLSKPSVVKAVKSLEVMKAIVRTRKFSQEYGDEATSYRLNFQDETTDDVEADDPVLTKLTGGGGKESLPGGVNEVNPQYRTVLQETDITSKRKILKRKGFSGDSADVSAFFERARGSGETKSVAHILSHTNKNYFKPEPTKSHQALSALITDISVELGDTQHLWSNLTQARNLHQASGLLEVSFVQLAYEAASVVRDKLHSSHADAKPIKNKMAYYFATLKERLPAGEKPEK